MDNTYTGTFRHSPDSEKNFWDPGPLGTWTLWVRSPRTPDTIWVREKFPHIDKNIEKFLYRYKNIEKIFRYYTNVVEASEQGNAADVKKKLINPSHVIF